MASFDTTIGLTCNAFSPGQPVDFDSVACTAVTIYNTSGVAIQYATDGSSFTTLANGGTVVIGDVNPTAPFRMRKGVSDSYPVAVRMTWNTVDTSSGGGGGATTYAALSDSAVANLPSINDPLATALAAKADASALAAKADAAATTAALAAKADAAAVSSALSAKADTSTMTTALAAKADTSALTAKANAASPVLTGPVTAGGSQVVPDAPMGAGTVIDVNSMGNSKTVSGTTSFSFGATPSAGSMFRLSLTVTVASTITLPTGVNAVTGDAVTSLSFPVGRYPIFIEYVGSTPYYTGLPGGLSSRDQLVVAQKVSFKQAIRKAYCRPFWLAHRSELIARNPPVGNNGTVYYVDPTKATNGVGTFADAFNVAPSAATWQGNTILFAEMTTYNLSSAMSNGGNNSFNFGTYSRYDGSRVYDPRRLATINALPAGNISSVMSFTGVASGSTAVFSGLRLTGARSTATPKGLYCGGSAAGSTLIVEHCIVDDVETTDAALVGALFDLRCEKMIVRFNRASGSNVDHFWLNAPSASTNVEFYGNEINSSATIDRNGPDAIQCNRASGAAYRHLNVYCNWVEHNCATKQGFFVAGSTPADGAESVWFHRNFLFGIADMTGQTDWAGDGSGHTAMQFDVWGYRVYSNYIDGWRSWGNLFGTTTSRALFAYNLCVTENSAFEVTNANSPMWGSGTGSPTASDYIICAHNTFWTINDLTASMATGQAVARLSGTNNKLNNNIFVGGWRNAWRLYGSTSQPTNYNLYFGVTNPVINNVPSVIAGGANDISADPLLDPIGNPRFGSPVVNAATPVTDWDGSLLYMTDPFGRTADGPRRQWIGAMQGYAS